VQHALLGTALQHFPIIGPQLQQNISSIHGSRLGVILGIRGAVYGGGVSVALQNAFRGWAWLLYARPNPCAASRWCVWPAVGTLTVGTTSWRLNLMPAASSRAGVLRHRNWSNGYTGSTSPASIRCTRSRPRRQESSATCAERRTSRGLSCAFRDRRDRLRSRVASSHQAGPQRCAGRGG
jgi:hypothetical protein